MKCLKVFSTVVMVIVFLSVSAKMHARSNGVNDKSGLLDSVKISLLTCSPGEEVYSLYGHTAIRYTDLSSGIDIAVNYGMFSFKKPFFVLRFIFGLTDYDMGIFPFDVFVEEYKESGRSVIQQELNLTQEEKSKIRNAIEENYRQENRTYRYNYFYDNCTTRARDIICSNLNGEIRFPQSKDGYPSFREMVHSMNGDHPWARLGNDLLLGVKADLKTDVKEHQFLPYNLMNDFNKSVIKDNTGAERALVEKSTVIIDSVKTSNEKEFPVRPITCAWIIFSVVVVSVIIEILTRKHFWGFDTTLMALDGLFGIVIFLMFFSQHPTTSTNLQIFLFNPLPLFYVYRVAKNAKKHKSDSFWKYAAASLILFFIGGFFQNYAEGTVVLALSLLVRCIWNNFRFKFYTLLGSQYGK